MPHFFEKRDSWGNGISLWIILTLVLFIPLICWSLQGIELENDVSGWLPEDDPQGQALKWYDENFDLKDSVIVSWEGCTLDDPRIDKLVSILEPVTDKQGIRRGGDKYVENINTPLEVLQKISNRGISTDEAVNRLEGLLIGRGYLKVALTDEVRDKRYEVQEIIRNAASQELGLNLTFHDPYLPAEDDLDEEELYLEEEEEELSQLDEDSEEESSLEEDEELLTAADFMKFQPHDFQISWPQMHLDADKLTAVQELLQNLTAENLSSSGIVKENFFTPGSQVALSITLNENIHSSEGKKAFMANLKAKSLECGISAEELKIGGSPYASAEISLFVRKSIYNKEASNAGEYLKITPTGMSWLVSILLAFAMLRSFRLAVLVLTVAIYTTLLTVALVPVTGGSMNMVLIVMPTLLTVLTLSAAIHVANYWKHAAHENLRTAVSEAVRMAWQPCVLASVTTAIGLLSLTSSQLSPVKDFGLYSAIGCIFSLLMVLLGLPALLQYWPARPSKQRDVNRSPWRKLANLLYDYRHLVSLSCFAAMIGSTAGLYYFRTETKVIKYFPDSAKIVQDYNFLEENLSGVVPIDAVVKFSTVAQDETEFLERMEIVRKVEQAMAEQPEISGTLSLADFNKTQKIPERGSGFRGWGMFFKRSNKTQKVIKSNPDHSARNFVTWEDENTRFSDQGDELWRISAQVAVMNEVDYGVLMSDIDKRIESVLAEQTGYRKNAEGDKTEVPLAGASHQVTGMVPLFLATQQAVLESLITSFGLAFLLIAAVMVILLKSPTAGVITMLPNLLPIGLVFGLISWSGMPIDIGTMITASVALGIAVDGTLHLLTWFRDGIASGKSRRESVILAMEHCGPAMWHTSAIVGLGLFMLYPADLLLVSRFGWLMASLVGTALVADIIFLPALLAGPLGALIENTLQNQETESEEVPEPHFRVVGPQTEVTTSTEEAS